MASKTQDVIRRTGVTTPQPANSHQALCIPEVLGLIFRNLTDEKTALANLARCCRLFSEAALNVLWRELLDLQPLLDLLPTNLWDEFGNVLRSTLPNEWTTFDHYARRIQIISANHSDLYYQLLRARPQVIPFSALRTLALGYPGTILIGCTTPLFPTSLHTLQLDCRKASLLWTGAENIIEAAHQVPMLNTLGICGVVTPTTLLSVMQFRHLRALHLHHMDIEGSSFDTSILRDFIQVISEMTALVDVSVPANGLNEDAIPPCRGFAHLEDLFLVADPIIIMKFADIITSQKVHTIRFAGGPIRILLDTFTEWRNCFDKLVKLFGLSLRSIHLIENIVDDGLGMMGLLQPLLTLHHLEHITMLCSSTVSVTSANIHDIASAWPALRSYRLGGRVQKIVVHDTENTEDPFQSLVHFSRLCPYLDNLTLRINGGDLPQSFEEPYSTHGLVKLRLDLPDNNDPIGVARFIDQLFPAVRDVLVTGNIDDEYYDEQGWENLSRVIRIFQAVRDQGRREGWRRAHAMQGFGSLH